MAPSIGKLPARRSAAPAGRLMAGALPGALPGWPAPRSRISRVAGIPSAPAFPTGMAGILALCLCLATLAASAATAGYDAATLQANQAAVNAIGQRIEQGTLTGGDISRLIDQVNGYRSGAAACIKAAQAETSRIADQVKALGPAAAGDSAVENASRADLGHEQEQAALLLADCRLLAVTSDEALSRLQHLQDTALTNHLLERGAPTLQIIRHWLSEPPAPDSLFDGRRLLDRLGVRDSAALRWLGALTLIGLVAGLRGCEKTPNPMEIAWGHASIMALLK